MANATIAPPTEAINIDDLARRALSQCDGEWSCAASLFQSWIEADAELFRAVMAPLLKDAVWQRIRKIARQNRRDIWQGPVTHGADRGAPALGNIGDIHVDNLLAFPLHGGKRLGDASRAEVEEAAHWYHTLARANGARGRWLSLVAQAMEDAPTVAEALDHNGLSRLREEAEG